MLVHPKSVYKGEFARPGVLTSNPTGFGLFRGRNEIIELAQLD